MPMTRALIGLVLLSAVPGASLGQVVGVLHITVSVLAADRKATPVPRHVLLVSDNPASAAPRRVVTALDGTATVRLPPGNYTVESDRPVAFQGKEYGWTQTLDVPAGHDTTLALTADNAEVGAISAASAPPGVTRRSDPTDALMRWQDSVVALWTPTAHASGFVIDAAGLLATNQRVVGSATAVEIQLTPTLKVAATVVASDPGRDVAILWADPIALATLAPIPLGCGAAPAPTVTPGQEVFTLGMPERGQIRATSGTVFRVEPRTITLDDFNLPGGSEGGPVFAAGGTLVGLTSIVDEKEASRGDESRVVRVTALCEMVAEAAAKRASAAPPSATPLPLEPERVIPEDVLSAAAKRRVGSLSPYAAASADFDIAFITPVLAYAGQSRTMDFANWTGYIADHPSVLLVRVTPKQVEKFWTTVARGVARTQGMALPPFTHFKPGFVRMRVLCGSSDVMPIHPFLIERRVSQTDAVREGLYVLDPAALGPHCGTVTLTVWSEKSPEQGDPVVIDPVVLQQIWQDFEMYRVLR
ncbi:MAG: serine protease [Acidobacteriota bacterium]